MLIGILVIFTYPAWPVKNVDNIWHFFPKLYNYNHDVVGQGAMYELNQPNDYDYELDYNSNDDGPNEIDLFDKIANY